MEDYLITVSGCFVDTESGEVLSNFKFSKPLSSFLYIDVTKYYDSFVRGVRLGRNVAMSFNICRDRDLPKYQQKKIF